MSENETKKTLIPQNIPLEKSNEERRVIVFTNVIKMLTNRKLINKARFWNVEKNNFDMSLILDYYKEFGNPADMIYKIDIDTPDKIFIVRILNQKISAINKTSGIVEHLAKYKKNQNILIVLDINNKSSVYINKNFPGTEIFLEQDLMFNIVENVLVPYHEVLNKDDGEKVISDYEAKKQHMPKIYTTDKIARYFNMQPGEVCKILRPSETSGFVPYYRLVVKAN